jgi:hypothetical protein
VIRSRFLHVAVLVFGSTIAAELLAFEVIYPGSTLDLLHHPARFWLLLFLFTVNLFNATVAAYFSHRAAREELLRRQREQQIQHANSFLNHHVRNALTGVQYAAYLTDDPSVIQICDEAVSRITGALVAAEHDMAANQVSAVQSGRSVLQPSERQTTPK